MSGIANSSLVKQINYNLIWDYLLKNTSATIPNISEEIGLSLPTVTRAIDYGIELGMVVPSEIALSTGGRKAQIYKLNSKYEYYLLIVLDNEVFHYQIRNFIGETIFSDNKTTQYSNLINDIDKIISKSLKEFKLIKKIAVAFTGVINDGVLIDCWRNNALNNFNFEAFFFNKYGVSITLENNMRAVTMATKRLVKNQDKKTVVIFEYGHTGYGSGISINGKVFKGASGFAGEIGSNPVNSLMTPISVFFTKQLMSLISILNPHCIVLYANDKKVNPNEIIEVLKSKIPRYAFPEFIFANNFLEDCFYGLNELCVLKSKEEL